jgi:predicted NAD/FAD-dependent oxidoreductase
LHGSNSDFLAALDSADAEILDGWPSRIDGTGTPCQPEAFHSHQRRLAYAEGVSTFPKHLAKGLDVRLNTRVASLGRSGDGFLLLLEKGDSIATRNLVLALPIEQILALLDSLLLPARELQSFQALFQMMSSLPCLTLLAGYLLDGREPWWDVSYPEESAILLLTSHDSAKRKQKRLLTLVYQCRSGWSRQHLDDDPTLWAEQVLEEVGRRLGSWAARPLWYQTHRWRYARAEPASALSQPMSISFPGGLRLGLAGELFDPAGGVEAAWLSGRKLARRFLGEEKE